MNLICSIMFPIQNDKRYLKQVSIFALIKVLNILLYTKASSYHLVSFFHYLFIHYKRNHFTSLLKILRLLSSKSPECSLDNNGIYSVFKTKLFILLYYFK